MSILDKLNPLKWIKDILVSDYVGGFLRHTVQFIGGYLTVHSLGAESHVDGWVKAKTDLLTDPQFIAGIIASVTAYGSSIVNKKVL